MRKRIQRMGKEYTKMDSRSPQHEWWWCEVDIKPLNDSRQLFPLWKETENNRKVKETEMNCRFFVSHPNSDWIHSNSLWQKFRFRFVCATTTAAEAVKQQDESGEKEFGWRGCGTTSIIVNPFVRFFPLRLHLRSRPIWLESSTHAHTVTTILRTPLPIESERDRRRENDIIEVYHWIRKWNVFKMTCAGISGWQPIQCAIYYIFGATEREPIRREKILYFPMWEA